MIPKFLQPERVPFASIELVPASPLRLICSWCSEQLQDGQLPASHTICPACTKRFEAGARGTVTMLLVLFALSVAAPLHAQGFDWTPSVLYASGSIADQVSTQRFLSNGSGCSEAARWIGGARPSATRLTLTTIGATAVLTTMHYLVFNAGKQTGHPTAARWINRVSGIVGGGIGWRAALNNVRDCPTGGR